MESMLNNSVSLGRVAWKTKCREEDLAYRDLMNTRRLIDDARRKVDEKAEQLRAIAELSTIIAGFTISALCEIQVPDALPALELTLFGAITSAVIAITMVAAFNSTYVLIALYNVVVSGMRMRFIYHRCENDWQLSFRAFTLGVILFMLSVCIATWVVYWQHPARDIAATIVTVIALASILYWYLQTYLKWDTALRTNSSKLKMSYAKAEQPPGVTIPAPVTVPAPSLTSISLERATIASLSVGNNEETKI